MPPQYNDLITNYLASNNVILSGIFDTNNKTIGENVIYKYEEKGNNDNICYGDIYLLCINSCYIQKSLSKDLEIFSSLLKDFKPEWLSENRSYNIGDWESAIDIIDTNFYPTSQKYNLYCMTSKDTLPLYKLSYELSKEFIGKKVYVVITDE